MEKDFQDIRKALYLFFGIVPGFLLLHVLFIQSALPCSTFLLHRGDAVVVGHNLDMPYHIPGMLVVNTRGETKRSCTWYEFTTGKKHPAPSFSWRSKYGSVTYGDGKDLPDGGMNEKGLYIGEMSLPETQFVEDDTKPKVYMVIWMQYVLDNCSSVGEVIQSVSQMTLDGWGWHFFTADAQGNAAVIEFLEGKPYVYAGKDLPIPALCNSNYSTEIEHVSQYEGFGGTSPVSLDDASLPRFVHAAHMLKKFDPAEDPPDEYGFDVLRHLERGTTQWSIVHDLKNLVIQFRTAESRDIRFLHLSALDFTPESQVKIVDIHTNAKGDMRKWLVPYTATVNKSYIKESTNNIVRHSPDFEKYLTSLGCTPEMLVCRLALYGEGKFPPI